MTSPLKIGLDARPALLGQTGFGRAARELLAALRRRDDLQVSGFGVCWHADDPGVPELEGVVRRRLPARLLPWLARLGIGVETWLGPLDVYQHTDLVFAPVVRAAQVMLLHDVVFLEDASWHQPGFGRDVEQRLRARLPKLAAVVVPSRRTAEAVLAHGLVEAARLHVIALGTDHIETRPRLDDPTRVEACLSAAGAPSLGPDELLVLLPGTREPRKNQLALLEAFMQVTRPGSGRRARLCLLGPEGWGCSALEMRLADPALQGRVVALGAMPEADLGAFLREADVVAYPSFSEGFGLPVFEALACGRAVLTSIDTPMADAGGQALLAVDPRDPAALATGLAELLDNPERRAELGRRGPAAVAELTWDATAAAYAALYRSLASAGPGRD